MKINKKYLDPKELKILEEDLTFKDLKRPLLKLENIHVRATVSISNELVNVYFEIKGIAVVSCAYSLEPTDYPLDFYDSIDISNDEKNIDAYYVPYDNIDLNPIILDLIIGEIPTRVIKKGAKLNKSGEGYRVLSESELKKQKEKEYNPQFDKLKDFDV